MKAVINGTQRELPVDLTLADVLREFGLRQSGLAVAINGRVVQREAHGETLVAEGDTIEIIRAVAGG